MDKIHAAMASIMRELAQDGITKDRRNTQGAGFNFRGIDDVMNAAGPLMAKAGVVVVPRYANRQQTERNSAKGGTLFCVVLEACFDFICAEDGSKVTVGPIFGEAFDSGDKATNKAMSIALKYAVLQTFMVPTEANHDPDAETHKVAGFLEVLAADLKACSDKSEVDAVLAKAKDAVGSLPAALKEQARKLAREHIERVAAVADAKKDEREDDAVSGRE